MNERLFLCAKWNVYSPNIPSVALSDGKDLIVGVQFVFAISPAYVCDESLSEILRVSLEGNKLRFTALDPCIAWDLVQVNYITFGRGYCSTEFLLAVDFRSCWEKLGTDLDKISFAGSFRERFVDLELSSPVEIDLLTLSANECVTNRDYASLPCRYGKCLFGYAAENEACDGWYYGYW